MVKIIGICGSPRKKSSYDALQVALEAAKAQGDVEVELIELRGKKINPCIHCNKCLKDDSDRCTIYQDDMTPLYDKFYQADGVLIMCPVYDMNITPQLAGFFSRFRSAWKLSGENPAFFLGKVGAAMSVAGTRNGGQEAVISNIFNFYSTHGMTICTGGGETYAGAAFWNPGDGSGTMDDPFGMNNAKSLGTRLAILTKRMQTGIASETTI